MIRALPRLDFRTDLQELEVVRKREQLQADITLFGDTAQSLFPQVDFQEFRCRGPPDSNPEIEGDDVEDLKKSAFDDPKNPFLEDVDDAIQPEDVEITLPSSFDNIPLPMKSARAKEIKVRVAQANDVLEGVRIEVGHKSYLYRSNVRLATGKKQKTRGYDAVKAADGTMRHLLRVYNHARWALSRLHAEGSILKRFKEVQREHTAAVTAIYEPNMRGQSNKSLPWIWTMDVKGDSEKSTYLEECECRWPFIPTSANRHPQVYCVNWLRAKCQAGRWEEEHSLLRCEMEWVKNFFRYKQSQCLQWLSSPRSQGAPGHEAYARRQASMWDLLHSQATTQYTASIAKVAVTVRGRELRRVDARAVGPSRRSEINEDIATTRILLGTEVD
jgi:hypothetical protein